MFTAGVPRQALKRLVTPMLSQQPAARLIRRTARQQWRLVALGVASSLVEAFSEGATLGVIFLAVRAVSVPQGQVFHWSRVPGLAAWPAAQLWLQAQPPTALFLGLLALAVLLQALLSVTRFVNAMAVGYFAARCRALITAILHSQILRFSFPWASRFKVGDLLSYTADGPQAVRLQIETSNRLLVDLLLCLTYLLVLLRISPWLLLAAAAIAALIGILQVRTLPGIKAGSGAVMREQVGIQERITENIQGLRLLHSTGQRQATAAALEDRMGQLEHVLRAQVRRLAVLGPFSSFLPVLAIAAIAAVSVLLLRGKSTGVLPSLVTFVLALQRLNQRMTSVASSVNVLANNASGIERLSAILDPVRHRYVRQGGQPFQRLERCLRFQAVTLEHTAEREPVLREVSFSLHRGETLALVGPSGAGKSSIADLLVGLYTPSSGEILIDDTPLEALDLESWQQRLGVVSQDTFLFNATIAENIAFGTPGATRAGIEAAAAAAQLQAVIASLPQGFDTPVGERGYRLSGGQRQRLSLARAFLRQPELLILDEATSALDTQSERLVQEAIERITDDQTLLVIAHRLSTIVRADQILVLDGGRVVERGNHSSLLAAGGLYAQLWQQQSLAPSPVLN